MPDSMIERIARALARQQGSTLFETGAGLAMLPADFEDRMWRDRVNDARAVLAAMREPTEAVTVDAIEYEAINGRATSRHVWTAMIDAALAEEA